MEQLPPLVSEDLIESFLDSYLTCLEEDANREKQFLFACEELYSTYLTRIKRVASKNDRSKYINETDWLKTSLFKLLEEEFPEKREIPFEEEFEHFVDITSVYLINTPHNVKLEQTKERFYAQPDDSFFLGIGKLIKRSVFNLGKLPLRFTNLFRKEKKPIHFWAHTVPLSSMIEHYFINLLSQKNLYAFEELMKVKCGHLNLNWGIIKDINQIISTYLNSEEVEEEGSKALIAKLEELSKRDSFLRSHEVVDNLIKSWREKGLSIFQELEADFRDALLKVNTLELSISKYGLYQLKEGRNDYLREYKRIFGGWKNSIFAQLDDIQIDIELYHIKYFGLMQYYLLRNSAKSRIEKIIFDHFKPIEKEFDELIENVEKAKPGDVLELIRSEKALLIELMSKQIVPKTIEALYDQDFPNLLDRMEFKITKAVEKMKDDRIIYAENVYDSPIKKSELSQFNPRELVQISILKEFNEQLSTLKSSVVKQLELLQSEIYELSGIIDYNLDSALNSQNEEENSSEKNDIKQIACEGINRTKSKTTKIQEDLFALQKTIDQELKATVEAMNEELVKLTINENITDLRLRLARAKAINKTFSIKESILEFVHRTTPKVIDQGKLWFNSIHKNVQNYLITIGIVEEEKILTAELSDFLLKTDEAIAKLPFVYKRLYRIDPLSEEIFFEGRQKELNQLFTAYNRWKDGKFEATIVIGEKGSGTSSLINFFLEKSKNGNFLRYKFNEAHSTSVDFYSLFQELLGNKKLNNQEALVKNLLEGERRIIILEDAQHLYLKRIGGFRAIQMLFDLISETSTHILWIIEVTTYTYDYLEKTIRISSYFKNKVNLQSISDEQMVNLIMRRHRVSGYNLEYQILNPGAKNSKKLSRLNEEGKQAYLKELYFKKLNEFAKSNISLALLYWIRSTIDVRNNTIYIGMMGDLKFEFLASMNDDSIFTLHALLLHDSLNVSEHAILFHQSEWQSKMNLMVLEDNGILKLVNERYHINRLLYRQVVNVLKQKNIIH